MPPPHSLSYFCFYRHAATATTFVVRHSVAVVTIAAFLCCCFKGYILANKAVIELGFADCPGCPRNVLPAGRYYLSLRGSWLKSHCFILFYGEQNVRQQIYNIFKCPCPVQHFFWIWPPNGCSATTQIDECKTLLSL